jgi:hypothetical protein
MLERCAKCGITECVAPLSNTSILLASSIVFGLPSIISLIITNVSAAMIIASSYFPATDLAFSSDKNLASS